MDLNPRDKGARWLKGPHITDDYSSNIKHTIVTCTQNACDLDDQSVYRALIILASRVIITDIPVP